MLVVNGTRMLVGYTLGLRPDGRECVVVVVKGTFDLPFDRPQAGSEVALSAQQAPFVLSDEFSGAPGVSAPLRESDFAPEKPNCDVLLIGSAHAPGGRPATRVTVSMQAGAMKKSFDVVGDREYGKSFLSVSPQSSRPFTAMPITYDRAYGGVDSDTEKPDKVRSFGPNPVGVGFYPYAKPNELVGKRLPNTEESGSPVTSPTGEYRAMSFGPVGRNFVPRAALAGTYDQDWLDNVFPFLPADFDPRYYQSAPPDQQIPYPSGGETFEMVNLTPHGRLAFRLPSAEVPIEFTLSSGKRTDLPANLDTVFIESDSGRVMLSWRASIPVSQGLPEVKECVVGRMPEGWYHARRLGKTYYPSIQHLSAARRKSRLEEDAS